MNWETERPLEQARMVMDPTSAVEARERVMKWIEETRQIVSLLPELLSADHQAGERVSAAQKEAERLHKDVEELRRENQHLRLEKDEITQVMAQIAAKLGVTPRRSPFERAASGEFPKPGDHLKASDPAKVVDGVKPAETPRAAEPPKA
jgi:chromosome segregation ATPase